ncbi:MAG: helix-turn-helix domain-containing protein [Prolixibacteraceae bacterium]
MSIYDLIQNGSKVNVTVSLEDLKEFATGLIDQTKRDLEKAVIDDKAETYPTPKQVSEILGVDLVTLWRWAKRGYLVPVEVGGKRRYLMSQVKALLAPNKKKEPNNGK